MHLITALACIASAGGMISYIQRFHKRNPILYDDTRRGVMCLLFILAVFVFLFAIEEARLASTKPWARELKDIRSALEAFATMQGFATIAALVWIWTRKGASAVSSPPENVIDKEPPVSVNRGPATTQFPNGSLYDAALHDFARNVLLKDLKGGIPRRFSIPGMPTDSLVCYTGGFSWVYPIDVGTTPWALRCWIRSPGNVKERWVKAKDYLRVHPSRYFVKFDYASQGIIAGGQRFPVSYMEWVDGATLCEFLEEHVKNTNVVSGLAAEFLEMVRGLHAMGIAHGDLQDGNIMVQMVNGDLNLKLIDYDSLFVPGAEDLLDEGIPGVPNYQHPNRFQVKRLNKRADYFSELVIYLSLRAYAERPDLWKKGQEQQLLFTSVDLENPGDSKIFKELNQFSPEVQALASYLKTWCDSEDLDGQRPLEEVVRGESGSGTAQLKAFFSTPTSRFGVT